MYVNKAERKKEIQNAVKKELKNLIAPVVFILIFVIAGIVISKVTAGEEEDEYIPVYRYEGDKKKIVMENDSLLFEMDPVTTYFTLTDKKDGTQWFSVPENAASDTRALSTEKDNLRSTLLFTYSNDHGADIKYNNYKYSITNGLYEVIKEDNKITVHYSIGDVEKIFFIPEVLMADRFDEYTSKMEKKNGLTVRDRYKLYDPAKMTAEEIEEIKADYPMIENGPIRVLFENTRENLKKQLEKHFASAGYTEEDYLRDKEFAVQTSDQDKPVFNITMIYELDGNDLKVSVPLNEIEYKKSFPIVSMQILPYFGAGGTEDTGYMLVPEGGGSVINFNNGKTKQNNYYANVYGWDYAQARKVLVTETRVGYGVFGISRNGKSMLCMLEDGASYAAIKANISGVTNSYNNVCSEYTILHREEVDVGARMNAKMFMYELALPDESLVQRYSFVESDSVTDMANTYHDYLCRKLGDTFSLNSEETSTPVAIEVLCAVDKMEQVLGVPVSRPQALTTYSEAQNLIKEISGMGVKNLSVKLSGWMNEGINQELLSDVDLIGRLGSKKDLKNLIAYTNEANIPFYLDAVTQFEHDSNIFDGFFVYTDAACYANKKRAELSQFSTVYFGPDSDFDTYYLLNPKMTVKMMSNIRSYAEKMNAYGISYRDTGYILSADYKRKAKVTREESLKLQLEELKTVKEKGLGIMTNVGNEYIFGISDYITNFDLKGYDYTILDGEVPFLFIAIHGFTNYSGEALNVTSDFSTELLKSVECGAGLSFVFMNADANALQDTLYTEYFGADFGAYKDTFSEIVSRYEKELGHTFNQRITDWEQLAPGVTKTYYEDGTTSTVNFLYTEYVTSEGKTIPARDYLVERQ